VCAADVSVPCAGERDVLNLELQEWRSFAQNEGKERAVCCSVLQCVAVCCRVLQCVVTVCCRVLQGVAMCCSVLQCVAVCCSVMQCDAVICSDLQCVAVAGVEKLRSTSG